ncbi:MAG TPA: M20/M25/M40 family metallo-hydrolase [Bacillota bacterium]|nr:M20/M25/M40 family metallo-hydrolase [Bacillota bacterium]
MTSQQIIELTKQLIAIPSTSDNPLALNQAVEFVANLVADVPGVTVERFHRGGKPSFLAYRGKLRPEKFDILLNGHVDVVPAPAGQFKAYEKDGKLFGRGALDMKGTALALTAAFTELINEVPYNLGLQIVSDEEVGGYDGVRLQIDDGVRAEFVVMGEYANDRNTIYNAARGLAWAEIAFKGKSAHGGHLWHGTNAVIKAGNFAGAILNHYPTPDKETWTTTASIANLSTPNDTYNKVPDSAVLKIDFRFTQEDPVFESRASLEAFIKSIDPDASLVNLATFEPAVNVEELNPYVQGLSSALRKITRKKPRFLGRPAGSDGRHYALIKNDIVEFGLFGAGSHSDHEYVELASFEEYLTVMRAFLRQPIPNRLKQQPADAEPLHERLLRKLVHAPTVSSDRSANNTALLFIEDFLRTRGMHVKRFERNGFVSLIAGTKPSNKRPAVLLNAHIDVVPGPDNMYKLALKDGRFVGRGVMDMKHAIAAYLTLVDTLKDDLSSYDFSILINSDEEVGSVNGAKVFAEELGYRPGVVVVPDGGTNWELETFAKGVQWIKLEATGKAGHASRPWEGDSAIRRLLAALKEIEALTPHQPQPTDTFISVGTITGGTTANQIPASASAMLDIRSGSVEEHNELPERIRAIAAAHNVIMTVLVNDPPCVTDPEHPLIKPMVDIVKQVTGTTHQTSYDYAVNDGRFFSAKGVPIIVINPECGGIHTDEEWLSRSSFAQFCEVLETYVRRVAPRAGAAAARKRQTVRSLAQSLGEGSKSTYIWYATYGSGLLKENFMYHIQGGRAKGSSRTFVGTSDPTPPKKDSFMSLPYPLYFSGSCPAWGGGGHISILPEPSPSAHTIARAYLITVEQFEEITAQQNDRRSIQKLPFKAAMQHGHATISEEGAHYDELVYCGTKDDIPVFTLTAVKPELPYMPPTPLYTSLLFRGLSENTDMDPEKAVDYMLSMPGIAGNYKKKDLLRYFTETNAS